MLSIEKYAAQINRLCESHRVKHLYLFGSALTDRYTSKSDIDLIVDFEPIDLSSYAEVFQKSIDLLEEKAIKNPYFLESINLNKTLIYGH
jgi:predicted nucleotidyltransferase